MGFAFTPFGTRRLFILLSACLTVSHFCVGQVTFVLRVAIQILAYVGLFIVDILILGHAPRVASLATHDTLNRIVGASSATTSTIKWIFSRLKPNRADSAPSTDLLLILFLSISYTIFVSLSDIGFLGFHACSVPGPSIFATPASINSTDGAQQFVAAAMVNGTGLSSVRAYHCDSSSVIRLEDETLNNCTSWRNGTYADSGFFAGFNSTDSSVLMPLQLTQVNSSTHPGFILNSFFVGATTQRVKKPIVERGLAIMPYDTGVTAVVGVPELKTNTKIDLSKAMAVEMDVGCMSLGVFASRSALTFGGTDREYFRTNGSWRDYTGPDYMESVLQKTVDDIRAYLQPFFNTSTMDSDGVMESINATDLIFSPAANVNRHRLPRTSDSGLVTPDDMFMGNCTEAFQRQLGIPVGGDLPGTMCSLLGIGGTRPKEGAPLQGFQRMICATATQVNMVAATVQVDGIGGVSLNVTRLPSDLTHLVADYWNARDDNGTTDIDAYIPYQRYTLNDNANSPTTHFIRHYQPMFIGDEYLGQGTAGNAISFMGHIVLDAPYGPGVDRKTYGGLTSLDEGFEYVNTGSNELSKWVGQVGGSYIRGSLAYNGWVALQASPVEVSSTGGRIGSCYKPFYALGFVPLVFSATVVMCWALLLLFSGSCFGNRRVKTAYGGVSTYKAAMCPGAPVKDTLVAWESSPQPHLQLLSKGSPLVGDADGTALIYLKSPASYP